jgi:serine phosphatase RsbU (regulator of sigma subunit)
VATAGHPAPVVVDGDGARFLEISVGRPIGAPDGADYEVHTTSVAPGVTVMLFTDGLFERRGEALDIGLERVRQAADRSTGLDDLVDGVFEALGAGTNQDDAAILAVRWTA